MRDRNLKASSSPQPTTFQTLAPFGENAGAPRAALLLTPVVQGDDPTANWPETTPNDPERAALYAEVVAALDALPVEGVREVVAFARCHRPESETR